MEGGETGRRVEGAVLLDELWNGEDATEVAIVDPVDEEREGTDGHTGRNGADQSSDVGVKEGGPGRRGSGEGR